VPAQRVDDLARMERQMSKNSKAELEHGQHLSSLAKRLKTA
jgi:hypothetical protein